MCLSIPAKITEIKQGSSPLMGIVDFGGVSREICLDYVPEAQVGQYALIHVGFASSLLDEERFGAAGALVRTTAFFTGCACEAGAVAGAETTGAGAAAAGVVAGASDF